jgi:hypothetical protein
MKRVWLTLGVVAVVLLLPGDSARGAGPERDRLMHRPIDAAPLPFPVTLKPYIVGGFRATREGLRAELGEPHFIETDTRRTAGGDEDMWAWELPSGLRFMVVLQVPVGLVHLLCDPPDSSQVIEALGMDSDKEKLQLLIPPIVHPAYSGP